MTNTKIYKAYNSIKNWTITHVIHIALIWILVGFVSVITYLLIYKGVNWQVLTGFATWVLAGGVVITFSQIREARRSTQAQIAMDLFRELRDENTIEKLRKLYDSVQDVLKPLDVKELSKYQKVDMDYVIDRFDVLGVLVDKGIVDKELAIDAYAGTPSLRCWYILREYIHEVRKQRGYFGDNLEGFARLALEHFEKTRINLKFHKKYEEDKGINLIKKLQEKEFRPRSFEEIKEDRQKERPH